MKTTCCLFSPILHILIFQPVCENLQERKTTTVWTRSRRPTATSTRGNPTGRILYIRTLAYSFFYFEHWHIQSFNPDSGVKPFIVFCRSDILFHPLSHSLIIRPFTDLDTATRNKYCLETGISLSIRWGTVIQYCIIHFGHRRLHSFNPDTDM
jgi:hypothetical protein